MAALRNRHLSLVAAFHQDPPAQNLTASSPLATDDFNVPVALFRKRCGGEFDRQPLPKGSEGVCIPSNADAPTPFQRRAPIARGRGAARTSRPAS